MDLYALQNEAAVCTCCELSKGRNKPVFAKGNPESEIFICGMVPADEENKVGLPFVGRAGQLLDEILADVSLSLDNVYITNLVKCYLAAGLPLKQDWIESCLPYLVIQIDIIRPKVIITLGKDATCSLLGLSTNIALGKIRKARVYNYGDIKVIPTYHPSYLLRGGGKNHRNYNNVVDDFLLSREILLD